MQLTLEQIDVLKAHSFACYPEEACAMLIGQGDVVEDVIVADNIADDKQHFFEIDPRARIRTEKRCRETKQRIIGIFHSHPGGEAKPSQTDEKMVIERHFYWLIASVTGNGHFELGAFLPRKNQAGFEAVHLSIKEK